jgi:[ribosomal protein S5]-alanine N-acetyltransferase
MRISTTMAGCELRSWREGDQADLVRHANSRKVWRNLTTLFPHPYSRNDADQWISNASESGRSVHLAIAMNDAVVGGIGAVAGDGIAQGTADFGYWLGESDWGRGIATAAASAFAKHLVSECGFIRLQAPVFEWNPASMRVLEKVGFVREGVLRRSVTKDGQVIDSIMYAYIDA